MFFKKKTHDGYKNSLEGRLQAMEQELSLVTKKLESLNKDIMQINSLPQSIGSLDSSINQSIRALSGNFSEVVSKLQPAIQKHDMAIEDLLDEWEEQKNEKLLLELFEGYQEQFWNLKRFASNKDGSWSAQIALMENSLEHYRNACGISSIQQCGILVDYNMHEVIEAIPTDSPKLDKTVAEIYLPGYLYKGKIQKKAQVTAYRIAK